MPSSAIGLVAVDGIPVSADEYTAAAGGSHFGAQVPINIGDHTVSGPDSFGLVVYGFGSSESYTSYAHAGASLSFLSEIFTDSFETGDTTAWSSAVP